MYTNTHQFNETRLEERVRVILLGIFRFRKALCCKMSVEFDVFLESNKK